MPLDKIGVLLVDDHPVVRSGVRMMLEVEPDLRVTGEAECAHQALALASKQRFSVALVDIALPGMNGLDLLKRLRAEHPALGVLMLSTYAESVYAVRALKHGAAGYLTKNAPAKVLVDAVRRVAGGGKYISSSLAEMLGDLMARRSIAPHDMLSDRELEVLKLIAVGESLVQIANTLHLSPHTVTTYRSRILQKTGVSGNAKLALYAVEHGLLT